MNSLVKCTLWKYGLTVTSWLTIETWIGGICVKLVFFLYFFLFVLNREIFTICLGKLQSFQMALLTVLRTFTLV